MVAYPPTLMYQPTAPMNDVNKTTSYHLPPSFRVVSDSLGHQLRSFLKETLMVLGDHIPNFFYPNMLVYDFRTSHINFNQNEDVKLDYIHRHTRLLQEKTLELH